MVIAFIGDIHGNIDALDAVFEDIDKTGVDAIICLGDVVGYGPEPGACVRRVLERAAVTVMGNHEAMMLSLREAELLEIHESVGMPLLLAREQLSEEEMEEIRSLPLAAEMDPLAAVHGSFHQPQEFNYVMAKVDARLNFESQSARVSFHSHTHVPAIWQNNGSGIQCFRPHKGPVALHDNAAYAINIGSVGQPRDHNPHACYLLFDVAAEILVHRRIPYDIERAQERILQAGLPRENAIRIAKGR